MPKKACEKAKRQSEHRKTQLDRKWPGDWADKTRFHRTGQRHPEYDKTSDEKKPEQILFLDVGCPNGNLECRRRAEN